MKSKIFISALLITLFILISGCKKIDLERIAMIRTDQPTNVLETSVNAYGSIIDIGKDESVQEYGFCLSYINKPPTINDKAVPPFENRSTTGDFSSIISSLAENKTYQIRAYLIELSGEVSYGNIVEFKTLSAGGSGTWLHYDDGMNADNGVGLTEGGSFDVAIRFPTQALQQYNGFQVTKIKFFPKEGTTTLYSITIWEGAGSPNLLHYEPVDFPQINAWTEFVPSYIYIIDSSVEFWVGYWVQDHPSGTYPAGVDDGPAITGAGNMFSTDNGETWDALSILYPDLDFNWNLQVYVTNEKGEEVQLVNNVPDRSAETSITSIDKNGIVAEKTK
ncbi:MAG: hypothetical protein K8R74_07340 [Bacteroidales bacterium]|nr:hypothetical protein [Bacteroidales bacterium]